jgi:hypothetical protein
MMKFLTLAVLSVLVACAPFDPGPPREVPAGIPGGKHVGTGFLQHRQCVEVRGAWRDGVFHASRFVLEEDDDEVVLRGAIGTVVAGSHLEVGAARLRLDERTVFQDSEGKPLAVEALSAGSWVKAETIPTADGLLLRKLSLRKRGANELDELQGRITWVDRDRRRLEIAGLTVRWEMRVPVGWDVKDVPVPAADASAMELSGLANGLMRVRRVDDDDLQISDQHRLSESISFAGEVQYDLEWRGNHDLQEQQHRDRLIHEASTTLEFTMNFSRQVMAFAKFRAGSADVLFDQDANANAANSLRVEEAFVLLEDLIADGVSLEIGRQDFDDGREWLMDESLDAVRLWLNADGSEFEFSLSRREFTSDVALADINNLLAGWHTHPLADLDAFFYAMTRDKDEASIYSSWRRHWYGASVEYDSGAWTAWLDASLLRGRESLNTLNSHGLDAMLMWAPSGMEWHPSLYAGYAMGSGSAWPPSNFQDGNFRQSGLNDNNDRLNGITSFRYLGELMRPELANLRVFTLGGGVRWARDFSVDLVWHHYAQDEASAHLFDSRLRLTPQGIYPELGTEWDLIVGFDAGRAFDMELVLAKFEPGRAFAATASDAWFLTLKAEYRF